MAKAVLGTSAVEDEAFRAAGPWRFSAPGRVVVAIDAEAGYVKTKGWQERSEVRVLDLAARLKALGVAEVLYTDISRDGMMQSVDLDRHPRAGVESSGLEVIASGGVTSLDDLRALKPLEASGRDRRDRG